MTVLETLRPVHFGQQVAEDETALLSAYFVETDPWWRILQDRVDIVYGAKGSGKSALYALLSSRGEDLYRESIVLALGEQPRGAPAFRDVANDPPADEREFVALWKLYFACLACSTLLVQHIGGDKATQLQKLLEDSGLRPRGSLQAMLHSAWGLVKRVLRPQAVEGTLSLDPNSGGATGVTTKVIFGEPDAAAAARGVTSVDAALRLADEAFALAGTKLWILLDRLDVAFSESAELETNALRALFYAYRDASALNNIKIKVFLRTDIWKRITVQGFREASHINRALTIVWNKSSLLSLVARRAAQNPSILAHVGKSRDEVLASAQAQSDFFYSIFPDTVDSGQRKSTTLDWMIARTQDGTKQPAPRELIHLLNALRDVQVSKLEHGEDEPEGGRLFSRSAFKDALAEVSRMRLDQTLYAEYPQSREHLEQLRGEKAQQTAKTLAGIWRVPQEEAARRAQHLVEIGFFEQRGDKADPVFWVPFLYRSALDLVQGAADEQD
jgi:hypothetical protein